MSRTAAQLTVIVALLLATSADAHAQDVDAASCEEADVLAALESVRADGATVHIPAGTCTWATTLEYAAAFSTTIIGAGDPCVVGGGDRTTILDAVDHDTAGDRGALHVEASAGKHIRVSGITFGMAPSNTTVTYHGSLQLYGSSMSLRVDHCHFQSINATSATVDGEIDGVFDHNLFDAPSPVWNFVHVYASGWGGGEFGDGSWADATTLGSRRFVFFEDNTFNSGVVEDCTNGGRFVIRHNTLNGSSSQTHPTGGANRTRGCRAWEIYENTFTAPNDTPVFNAFFSSAGTGVFRGNSSPSGYENLISIHAMRADSNTYMQAASPAGWGYCGTQVDGADSPWDENTDPASGYACLDQPGRGKGDLLANDFPSAMNTVTGGVQWPHQALEPVYEWLDTYSPAPGYPGNVFAVYDAADLVANRDFYQYTATFDGKHGVGAGTLAARPTTCTPLVAYWATDERTLYQCATKDTWTTFYKPATYPHPLAAGGDGCGPGPDGGPPAAAAGSGSGGGSSGSGESSGGCGCRASGARPGDLALTSATVLVLLGARRRRRARRSTAPSAR